MLYLRRSTNSCTLKSACRTMALSVPRSSTLVGHDHLGKGIVTTKDQVIACLPPEVETGSL